MPHRCLHLPRHRARNRARTRRRRTRRPAWRARWSPVSSPTPSRARSRTSASSTRRRLHHRAAPRRRLFLFSLRAGTTGPFGKIKIFIPNGPVTSPPGALSQRAGGARPSRKNAFSRLGAWSERRSFGSCSASIAPKTMMSRAVTSARIVPSRRPRSRMRWSVWWTLDLTARVSAAFGTGPPCRGRTSWSAWLMTQSRN